MNLIDALKAIEEGKTVVDNTTGDTSQISLSLKCLIK